MGVVGDIEVEVVVAAQVLHRHAAGCDDLLETPVQQQVVTHHGASN